MYLFNRYPNSNIKHFKNYTLKAIDKKVIIENC